jgi:hypothetical protein
MSEKSKENEIISKIVMSKIELIVLKSNLGPATVAMAAGLTAQYAAHISLMRQNGATFTDILTMLTEDKK